MASTRSSGGGAQNQTRQGGIRGALQRAGQGIRNMFGGNRRGR